VALVVLLLVALVVLVDHLHLVLSLQLMVVVVAQQQVLHLQVVQVVLLELIQKQGWMVHQNMVVPDLEVQVVQLWEIGAHKLKILLLLA
jgi:hypothetical protein